MLAPVVPFAMEKVWAWLGLETPLWQGGFAEASRPIPPGRLLGTPEILFPRVEDEVIAREVERLQKLIAE
jgi:methionyl-tRNA synthetase